MGHGRNHATARWLTYTMLAIIALSLIGLKAAAADDLEAQMKAAGLVHFKESIEAPDFQIQATDGTQIRLRDFQGRPVLLNFWATW